MTDLDRLMAERVMEWHQKLRSFYSNVWFDGDVPTQFVDCRQETGNRIWWHPSEDIAQAMMCAEKTGLGFTLSFIGKAKCLQYKGYSCTFFGGGKHYPDCKPYDLVDLYATPALAICRAIEAALKGNQTQPKQRRQR